MEPAEHLVALDAAVTRMAQTITDIDLAVPVPTCPGWSLGQLVEHLGRAHLWAAQAARTGTRPDPYPEQVLDGRSPAEWYADSAGELVTALSQLDPAAPAWTFARHDRTSGFWRRRQLHETTIHWVDAMLALGRSPDGEGESAAGLSVDVCQDGVDEVLGFFCPRGLARAGRDAIAQALPGAIAVTCTDAGQTWTLSPAGDDVVVSVAPTAGSGAAADQSDPAATVTGRAIEVYLGVWNRSDRDTLRVTGDPAVAERFLAAPLVP